MTRAFLILALGIIGTFTINAVNAQEVNRSGVSEAQASFEEAFADFVPIVVAEVTEIDLGDISEEIKQLELEPIVIEPVRVPTEAEARDIQCLARNVYFEARGEPLSGRYAVANVTMNRVNDERFPDNVCDVVYQRNRRACQFSWVCNPTRVNDMDAYEDAVDIASEVYYNEIQDITEGAQYFHATYVRPRWSRVFERTYMVGNHVFYRE